MDKNKFIDIDDPNRPDVFEREFGENYFDNNAKDDVGNLTAPLQCPSLF